MKTLFDDLKLYLTYIVFNLYWWRIYIYTNIEYGNLFHFCDIKKI